MRWLLLVGALAVPGIADAHIHLTNPLSRIDTLAGTDQKVEPCGVAGQQRTTRVSTYKPGQTITVTWLETIDHPGWFRIAFQPNGAGFSLPAPNAANTGSYPTASQEGMTLADGSIILKDRIADGTLTADVTLPNVECSNCTLQFTQFMTNNPPYTIPQTNDVYFNCADIVLAADAPDAGPGAGGGGGDVDAGTGSGSNNNNATIDGGCSTGGGTGLAASLALLGLVGVRRRRR